MSQCEWYSGLISTEVKQKVIKILKDILLTEEGGSFAKVFHANYLLSPKGVNYPGLGS